MAMVNVHEAKTRLSQLLSAAEAGEDVVIARQGTPVARLVPIKAAISPEPGIWRTQPGWSTFSFAPEVLAPLQTDEDLAGAGWPA
jgi:prevent-host-death family protein